MLDTIFLQKVLDDIKRHITGEVDYLLVPTILLEDGSEDKQVFRDVLTLAEEQQDELYPRIKKLLLQAELL